jgi:ketosteroid isomerase-like protein
VDAAEAARAWIAGYSSAWKARDADAVASLYADDATYRSQPFREPLHGHAGVVEYTRWAFSSEQDVDFWFGEPLAAGDGAAVEYWAVILEPDGGISTLAGAVVLRFAEDGRVAEHRDYWAVEQGRRPPYDGWAG